jgi:hypothetical protein
MFGRISKNLRHSAIPKFLIENSKSFHGGSSASRRQLILNANGSNFARKYSDDYTSRVVPETICRHNRKETRPKSEEKECIPPCIDIHGASRIKDICETGCEDIKAGPKTCLPKANDCKPKKCDDPCKNLKKPDPCIKDEDPCKKPDPCKPPEDPCKKPPEDPCAKPKDPCKKTAEVSKILEDLCKEIGATAQKVDDACDPCKKFLETDPCVNFDPCKPNDDPCKPKADPCKPDPCKPKPKEDPCKPKKPKDDPCKPKPKEDPCEPKPKPCRQPLEETCQTPTQTLFSKTSMGMTERAGFFAGQEKKHAWSLVDYINKQKGRVFQSIQISYKI